MLFQSARFVVPLLLASGVWAQTGEPRVSAEVSAAGLVPLSGYRTVSYSTGPGIRGGAELRLARYLSADAGWTGAWIPGSSCSSYGCDHPTYLIGLIDYGLRGILPLAGGRVQLSAGVGGGYIRYDKNAGQSFGNGALFQYSGKVSLGINRSGSLRVTGGVRL